MSPDGGPDSRNSPGVPGSPGARGDEIGFALPEPPRVTQARVVGVVLAVALFFVAVFLVTYLPKRRERADLEETSRAVEHSSPRVEAIEPKALASNHAITLPGSVKPLEETVIYCRANGYVRDWKVDIGDKVKEGDLLADVETPELDQEIMQARASLAQAEAGISQATANRNFSRSNLDRYQKLAASGLATQQDLDSKAAQAQVDEANLEVAKAVVGTQQANLARLGQLKKFAKVTAPFGGTITARMIDRGALVAPGTTAPLFRLAATDPVRVFVNVPQDAAPGVRADMPAAIAVREYPTRAFAGKVSRTSGALDPSTRTLSTEIRAPNPDGALITGMYADVTLTLPTPHRVYELPATAILTDAKGVQVEVVDEDGTIRLTPVVVERDLGATVHVSSGLHGTEHVVKLARAELNDGTRVEVAR